MFFYCSVARVVRDGAKQSKRVLITIALIIASYWLCWAPYHVWTVSAWLFSINEETGAWLHSIYNITIALNVVINPILYTFLTHKFHTEATRMLMSGRRKSMAFLNKSSRFSTITEETDV